MLTDIDKLNPDYLNIYIEDHQFAHYNLYNARDSDIYFYYQILISKHNHLGVPISYTNIDSSKIINLGLITPSNIDDKNDLEYLKILLAKTTEHPTLYPINIYWLNNTNYVIPYNIIDSVLNSINSGKKFIIMRINIIGQVLHANILLIDVYNKRIIRFEPQGGIAKDNINELDDKIYQIFNVDKYFKNYKYYKPSDYEPINGFQSLSQETNTLNVRKGDINGFCVAWCLWFVEFYIQNTNSKLLTDSNFKLLVPKIIKRLINSGYMISEYIRNYANYMHQKLVILLTSKSYSYTAIYYDRYSDNELDSLYNHIDLSFKNQN